MNRFRASGTASVFALVLAACGSDGAASSAETPGDSASTMLVPDQALAALAETFCRGVEACCAKASFVFDGAACRRGALAFFRTKFEPPASVGKRLRFDAEGAASCNAELTNTIALCSPSPIGDAESCRPSKITPGTLGPGEACNYDAECAGTDVEIGYCGSDHACSTKPRVAANDRCSRTEECQAGLTCAGARCLAQKASGSCESNPSVCARGSYCNAETEQCTPQAGEGEACAAPWECLGLTCTNQRCGSTNFASPLSCQGVF